MSNLLSSKKTIQIQTHLITKRVMWERPIGSIAVGCSIRAIMPLSRTDWSLLLHTRQQRLQILFIGPDNPKIAPSRGGS